MIDFSVKPPFFIENLLTMMLGQATQLLRHTNILQYTKNEVFH